VPVAELRRVGEQGQRLLERAGDVARFAAGLGRPREAEEVLDDARQAVRLLDDDAQQLAVGLTERGHLGEHLS
jgi:hypothetical protein